MADAHAPGAVFGEQLRITREHKRWTQQRLSDRTRELGHPVDRATIAKIERGSRRNVALDDALALAAALNVSPVHLFAASLTGDKVAVTPELVLNSREVRQWLRGQLSLDETDDRFYFSEVSDDEWIAQQRHGIQYLLRLTQDLVAAAADDDRDRMIEAIDAMNDELARQHREMQRGGATDSAGRQTRPTNPQRAQEG